MTTLLPSLIWRPAAAFLSVAACGWTTRQPHSFASASEVLAFGRHMPWQNRATDTLQIHPMTGEDAVKAFASNKARNFAVRRQFSSLAPCLPIK